MNLPKTSTPIDWAALLGALIVLSLSIIISVLLILGSQQSRDHKTEWERQQRSKFGVVEAEYTRRQEALEIVNSLYLDTFNKLAKIPLPITLNVSFVGNTFEGCRKMT